MDANLQLIVYVLLIVLSIAVSIIKKIKQSKEGMPAPPKETQWDWESETQERQPAPVMKTSTPANNYSLKDLMAAEGGRTTMNSAQAGGKRSALEVARETSGNLDPVEIETSMAADFDLKKAVIFSEILKPRYNEY